MPIGYIQPIQNPYVGIDVGYFDRKALELQKRHDDARAAWSESVQTIAGTDFIDAGARAEFQKY